MLLQCDRWILKTDFKINTSLLNLLGTHIMHPNFVHLQVSPYPYLISVAFPRKRKQSKQANKSKKNPKTNQSKQNKNHTRVSLLFFLLTLHHFFILAGGIEGLGVSYSVSLCPLSLTGNCPSCSRPLIFGTPSSLDMFWSSSGVSCFLEILGVLFLRTCPFTSSNRT